MVQQVHEATAQETVDLQYLLNKAIDAAEREGIMVLGTMVGQLQDAGLNEQAQNLKQTLGQRIPVSAVNQVLSHWISEDDLVSIK